MLVLDGISKSFAGQQVLEPTTIQFEPGKTTVLLGPSGCGKSTLLRIAIGLIEPDTGSVTFEGEQIDLQNLMSFRHRVGYMIQEGGLFPHLTIRNNVALMARQLNWETSRIEQRLEMLVELTHLSPDLLDRFPTQVSGGQRQRAALMRALFLEPDVVLLDEPMGALDPLIRADLQSELKQIFQSLERTVVLVTHDMGEAAYLGDSIAMLKEGRIVQQGSFEELVNSPADPFVSRFINAQRSVG